MLSSGIPWNMPRVTCIFRIHTSLLASVYKKKIQVKSVMFHGIPRESIAQLLYPMPKSSENLRKFSEELGNLQEISKNFGNASNPFLRSLNDLRKF